MSPKPRSHFPVLLLTHNVYANVYFRCWSQRAERDRNKVQWCKNKVLKRGVFNVDDHCNCVRARLAIEFSVRIR